MMSQWAASMPPALRLVWLCYGQVPDIQQHTRRVGNVVGTIDSGADG